MSDDALLVFDTIAGLRQHLGAQRAAGRSVAFVPTMGALHDGHLGLMRLARGEADVVVASVFVNPTQFGPKEDLAAYPRDLPRDLELCRSAGVDVVFAPTVAEMYPRPGRVIVQAPALAAHLCGRSRPGHFQGVCTVVSKLLHIVQPDVAIFGQKDFQQLAILRAMVEDLDMPVRVVGAPTAREPDGLAMSSRNVYLGAEARRQAACLSRGLAAARAAWASGERRPDALRQATLDLITAQPLADLDYLEVVDPGDLQPLTDAVEAGRSALIAVACRFEGTRLIDNTLLDP